MSAPQPLLERAMSTEPANSDAAAQAAEDSAWLERIIALTRGPGEPRDGAPSLDGLLATGDSSAAAPVSLPLDRLMPNPLPLRRRCDAEGLAQLAASIAEHGLLAPILVRPAGADYEVVAGLRRYEAAKLAGLREVPVVVLALRDRDAIMLALVENLQRDDLTALDEAQAYFRLLDEFGWTQDELAHHLGRSRSHIANTLRLLGLPAPVKRLLEDGALSAGHARALLGAADPTPLAKTVAARHLSVRQTEALVRNTRPPAGRAKPRLDAAASHLESQLARGLGLMVRLQPTRRGGKLTIYYRSPDELDAALRRYAGNSGSAAPDAAAAPLQPQ